MLTCTRLQVALSVIIVATVVGTEDHIKDERSRATRRETREQARKSQWEKEFQQLADQKKAMIEADALAAVDKESKEAVKRKKTLGKLKNIIDQGLQDLLDKKKKADDNRSLDDMV